MLPQASSNGRKQPRQHQKKPSAPTVIARTLLALLATTVAASFYAASHLHGSHGKAIAPFFGGLKSTRRILRDGTRWLPQGRRRYRYPLHVMYTPLSVGLPSPEEFRPAYRFQLLPFSLLDENVLQPGQQYQSSSSDEERHSFDDEDGEKNGGEDSGDFYVESSLARRDSVSEVDEDGCVPMKSWMTQPLLTTCNDIMEIDLARTSVEFLGKAEMDRVSFRFVEGVDESGESVFKTYKTLKFNEPMTARRSKLLKKDTKVMERLTSSPYVMNIYSFCSASQIVEYSSGSVHDLIKEWRLGNSDYYTSTLERLRIAAQIAGSIADLHTVDDGDGKAASIAHNDLSCHEIVRVRNNFKLQSFGLSKLLRKDVSSDETCLEKVPYCMQKMCSPEQYEAKAMSTLIYSPPTDVFAMGNILYYLLTNQWLFEGVSDKDARIKLRNGERSPYPKSILDTSDPSEIALRKAIDLCWVHEPRQRPSARKVYEVLSKELDKLDGGLAKREGVVRVQAVPLMRDDHRYTDNDFWDNLRFGM
uniref:Protein kinase domain-containing protein n=1 Tax=Odontella aurita TaxID=265563 RepID=A0A7S4JKY4_9STRA